MALAFAAAGTAGFSLFVSFDMNYFFDATKAATIATTYLTPYGSNSAYFTYNNQAGMSVDHLFQTLRVLLPATLGGQTYSRLSRVSHLP